MLLAAVATQTHAQADLLAAIDRLAQSKKAKVAHSVSYSRPTSDLVAAQLGTAGSMKSMLETYSFTMKAEDAKLVDDIVQAMYAQKDNPDCYRIEGYTASSSQKPRAWNLVYGEDATSGIEIGKNNVYNYTFVNIADKSTASQYRTCYCIEWREWMKKIDGRVIITYARIPRPDTVYVKNDKYSFDLLNKWKQTLPKEFLKMGEVMPLINALRMALIDADPDDAYVVAPFLYKVIKDAVDKDLLTKEERDIVSQQLKRAITSAELPSKPYDQNAQATLDYLRLAVKVLEQPQPLP
ncbi:hypothetical protein C7Y71_004425 [Pseudoprevotella muciniphila]|uniref:Uncharacterized protein n=1 Tax=Pseudoprevotella muciniphila TaxID=2133944 RepID=A0A5P8E5K1_9BACT|nr:hypothetical protein C7Y71_004425 [Pseudoprevotella muciniphila]